MFFWSNLLLTQIKNDPISFKAIIPSETNPIGGVSNRIISYSLLSIHLVSDQNALLLIVQLDFGGSIPEGIKCKLSVLVILNAFFPVNATT